MDKFLKLNSSSAEKSKVKDPIKGLSYDLDLLVNTKKYKPNQIEELSDQISQGSPEPARKTRETIEFTDPDSYRRKRSDREDHGSRRESKGDDYSEISQRSNRTNRSNKFSESEINDLVSSTVEKKAFPVPESSRHNQIRKNIDQIVISDTDESSEDYTRKHDKHDRRRRDSSDRHHDDRHHDDRHHDDRHHDDRHHDDRHRYDDDRDHDDRHHDDRHHDDRHHDDRHHDDRHHDDRHHRDEESGLRIPEELRDASHYHEAGDEESEHLTHRQIVIRKRRLMLRSARLEKKGYPPATKLNMTMSLEDMDEIVSVQCEERALENSIRLQGDILTGIITGTEKLNQKYDPADIHLDGWSESFYENLDNYDEVFEELYYKYNEKVHVEPEIKLIGMVLGSGMAYHFSKTVFDNAKDSVPGFEQIMATRPDLAQAYREAALGIMGQQNGMPMRPTPGYPPPMSPPRGPPRRPPPQAPQVHQAPPPVPPQVPAPTPAQVGGGSPQGMSNHPMGQMLGGLTGNPFLGNLLNNFLNQPADSEDEDDAPSYKSKFQQRRKERKTKRQNYTKPVTATQKTAGPRKSKSQTKYPKVFKGVDPNKIESDMSEVQDIDDLLSGVISGNTREDFSRKTRRNRSV